MSKHWARQEAKRNELAEAVTNAAGWASANRQQAMAGAGAVIVALLLGGYFFYQKLIVQRAAWRTLAVAQSYAYQGQFEPALSQLQLLTQQFNGTPAWGFGVLLTGDIYFREGQYKKSAEAYQKLLERQTPKNLLPFALSDQALALEAANDCQAAVDADRRFLDLYKDHFLAPQSHASLARCLGALGRKDEAKAAYQQMTTLYPEDPYWTQWAQSRLKISS